MLKQLNRSLCVLLANRFHKDVEKTICDSSDSRNTPWTIQSEQHSYRYIDRSDILGIHYDHARKKKYFALKY